MTRKQRKNAQLKELNMRAIEATENGPKESISNCIIAWRRDQVLYAALAILRRRYEKQNSPGAKKPYRSTVTIAMELRK